MGTSNTTGFISINHRLKDNTSVTETLKQRDIYSIYAQENQYKGFSSSTVDILKLKNIVDELINYQEEIITTSHMDLELIFPFLNKIPLSSSYQSQFKGYWGQTKDLVNLSIRIIGDERFVCEDMSLPHETSWIRIHHKEKIIIN